MDLNKKRTSIRHIVEVGAKYTIWAPLTLHINRYIELSQCNFLIYISTVTYIMCVVYINVYSLLIFHCCMDEYRLYYTYVP